MFPLDLVSARMGFLPTMHVHTHTQTHTPTRFSLGLPGANPTFLTLSGHLHLTHPTPLSSASRLL